MASKAGLIRGGDQVAAALDKIATNLVKAGELNLRVGFLEGAAYPDETPVAEIAALQEYGGTVTIPAHQVTVYRKVDKAGDFVNGGRFVKASKSNFATDHEVPEHTVTIPPRPFMRQTVADGKGHWGSDLGKLAVAANGDVAKALGQMGDVIKGDIQQTIRDFADPPNAPKTVARKGFNKPLVDTGHMLRSVGYEVSKK